MSFGTQKSKKIGGHWTTYIYLCDPDPFFWRGKNFSLAIFVFITTTLYTTVQELG